MCPPLPALLLLQHLPQAVTGAGEAARLLQLQEACQVPQEHSGAGQRLLHLLWPVPPGSASLHLPDEAVPSEPGVHVPEGADQYDCHSQHLPGPPHLFHLLQGLPGPAEPADGVHLLTGHNARRKP